MKSKNPIIERFFESKLVRIEIDENGKVWYHGGDVCAILGYVNSGKTIIDHCDCKGITKRYTLTPGGRQQATFVDFHNIIRLVMRSNKPEAKRFEKWAIDVIEEVLTTGHYSIHNQEWLAFREDVKEGYKVLTNVIYDERLMRTGEEPKFYHYTNEADLLNRIVFGLTAKEWEMQNQEAAQLGKNQRDFATPDQLKLLDYLETADAILVKDNVSFEVRKDTLLNKKKEFMTISKYYLKPSHRTLKIPSIIKNHKKSG